MIIRTINDVTTLLQIRVDERKELLKIGSSEYFGLLGRTINPPATPEEFIKLIEQEIKVLENAIEILINEWL